SPARTVGRLEAGSEACAPRPAARRSASPSAAASAGTLAAAGNFGLLSDSLACSASSGHSESMSSVSGEPLGGVLAGLSSATLGLGIGLGLGLMPLTTAVLCVAFGAVPLVTT